MMTRMLGAGNDNTHLYTADDERVWTIDAVLGGGEAGSTQTFRLRDSDAEVLREYRLLGTNVAGHWSQVKDYIYRDGGHLLASVSPSAGAVHYTLDHLGTPRLVTNSTGGYVSDHHYYAYGEELNPQANETKKFTGHERDFNEAGQGTTDDLDYMHARYESPITGRFLSVDRITGKPKVPLSWNRYTYALGNPVRYIDPDGLATTTPWDYAVAFGQAVGQTVDDVAFIIATPMLKVEVGILNDDPVEMAEGYGMILADAATGVAGHALAASARVGTFASRELVLDHFTRHGADVGAKTAGQYLKLAQSFVKTEGAEGVQVAMRGNGDKLLYNAASKEFSVVSKSGTIRTYFTAKAKYWENQLKRAVRIK